MIGARSVSLLLLAGLAGIPHPVRAGELYSYVDEEGVAHFSNAPSDPRYRRVHRNDTAGGLYRRGVPAPQARVGAAQPGGRPHGRWLDHIRSAAERYKLPVALLRAVMAVESNFDPAAVSEKGAVGLMQLMPATAKDMYVSDAYDPAQNIEGGARYLRVLANQYGGDIVRTVAAYNAGPEAVRRAGGSGVPDIPETREYVRKVLALYSAFKAEG
jgi:soluble lytic murein transglycosylase-like protein